MKLLQLLTSLTLLKYAFLDEPSFLTIPNERTQHFLATFNIMLSLLYFFIFFPVQYKTPSLIIISSSSHHTQTKHDCFIFTSQSIFLVRVMKSNVFITSHHFCTLTFSWDTSSHTQNICSTISGLHMPHTFHLRCFFVTWYSTFRSENKLDR